jgi:hypothetical protein
MKTDIDTNKHEELHIDDLDGIVTLFKSTDEGTETIAVFDEEHREVIQDLLAEVKRLREENDLLRSMQSDGIEASAHDKLLLEINRLREDNEKLHDAINRSFHAKISGSALEIYNGWWEGEEE